MYSAKLANHRAATGGSDAPLSLRRNIFSTHILFQYGLKIHFTANLFEKTSSRNDASKHTHPQYLPKIHPPAITLQITHTLAQYRF